MNWQELPPLPAPISPTRRGPDDAAGWLARLQAEIPWEQHRVRIFGRELDAPRLSCWVGDAGAATPTARALRATALDTGTGRAARWLQAQLAAPFNAVLCNLYRDGRDSIGWHSDDEPELGPEPVIASLSFRCRAALPPAPPPRRIAAPGARSGARQPAAHARRDTAPLSARSAQERARAGAAPQPHLPPHRRAELKSSARRAVAFRRPRPPPAFGPQNSSPSLKMASPCMRRGEVEVLHAIGQVLPPQARAGEQPRSRLMPPPRWSSGWPAPALGKVNRGNGRGAAEAVGELPVGEHPRPTTARPSTRCGVRGRCLPCRRR